MTKDKTSIARSAARGVGLNGQGAQVLKGSEADLGQPQPFLRVMAVATRLGVSVKTVRRMITSGDLPVHRIGKLLRVSEADLAVFVESMRQSRPNE